MTALNAIVELVKADGRSEDLNFLLDIIENDPEPRVRHQLLLMLAQHPPFERGRGHPLDTTSVMEKLWKLMKYAIIVIYCEFQMMTFFLFFFVATVSACLTTRDFATISSTCTTAFMDDANRLAFPEPFTKEWLKLHQQLSNQLKL